MFFFLECTRAAVNKAGVRSRRANFKVWSKSSPALSWDVGIQSTPHLRSKSSWFNYGGDWMVILYFSYANNCAVAFHGRNIFHRFPSFPALFKPAVKLLKELYLSKTASFERRAPNTSAQVTL